MYRSLGTYIIVPSETNMHTHTGAMSHLNSCFKHFIFFALEFELIDDRELGPLQLLIKTIVNDDARRGGGSSSNSSNSGGGAVVAGSNNGGGVLIPSPRDIGGREGGTVSSTRMQPSKGDRKESSP